MATKTERRRTAPEIIGFHLGWDIRDVSEGRYQRHAAPAVYVCAGRYFCCPSGSQKPPSGYAWVEAGRHYGRTVFVFDPADARDAEGD